MPRSLAPLLELTPDALLVVAADATVAAANAAAAALFGPDRGPLVGHPVAELVVLPRDWVSRPRVGFETTTWPGRGGPPVELSIKPVRLAGGPGWTLALRDITARRQIEQGQAASERLDAVTGLPNRLALIERLGDLLSRPEPAAGALLFVAFGNYRDLHDRDHRDLLDDLLRAVARRLERVTERTDSLMHLGDGEFALLRVRPTAGAEADALAQAAIARLEPPYRLQGQEVRVEAHVGIAGFPEHGRTPAELMRHADLALSQARGDHDSSVLRYTPALSAAVTERRQIARALRAGLAEDQFELRFQPKVALDSGRLAGAEALLRWRHPVRGLVGPTEFIAIAEASNVILPLGGWVLDAALAQAARWAGTPAAAVRLAVNISANQFRRQALPELIAELAARHGVDPSRLELEMTESVVMGDFDLASRTLAALRRAGIRIAIDDFGTGYSSLSYLHRLPADALKIDQSFVRRLRTDAAARAVTRTIITLAGNLGLTAIAEGIEHPDEARFLADHGCRVGQGYLYAPPLDAAAFAGFAAQDAGGGGGVPGGGIAGTPGGAPGPPPP